MPHDYHEGCRCDTQMTPFAIERTMGRGSGPAHGLEGSRPGLDFRQASASRAGPGHHYPLCGPVTLLGVRYFRVTR